MAPMISHLLPSANLVESTEAPNAHLGLAIERAYIDAGRLDCHDSGRRVSGLHFNGDMRQPLEALESRMIKARVVLRLIGRNRYHRAHMARSYAPHVQVDTLVPPALER